ncbi:MAG: DUF2849 domain-containing protein [Gammaproteobacteria bacterium]|nr:DUF2849 domain-containing protein [Gammaproteobacteria bacterium]
MTQVIIANRLGDGVVVFRGADNQWVESINDSLAIDNDAQAESLLNASQEDEVANLIIDPYLIEVTETDGQRVPTVYREAIRANGPSIQKDGQQ